MATAQDHADWAGARVLCGAETHLSDLTWTSMTNAWGPVEQDRSNGEQLLGDGRTITLNGVTYSKGLGVHGASDVRYSLSGLCSNFLSDIGMDDEVGTNGSVVFQVWTDGTLVYDSGAMTGSTATQAGERQPRGQERAAAGGDRRRQRQRPGSRRLGRTRACSAAAARRWPRPRSSA